MLRKGKEVGQNSIEPELEPPKQKKYLRSGALYNILEQKRKASYKIHSSRDDRLHGSPVRRKRSKLSRFTAPSRVVLDSPPALSTRAASRRMICSSREPSPDDNQTEKEMSPGNSRKTRRSLIDQVEELVEEAPTETEWEPENVAELEPNQNLTQKMQQGTFTTANTEAIPEQNNLNNHSSMNEAECSNANSKKKRGKTKLSSLAKKNYGLIQISWNNKGQPIGMHSVWLSSFLGALVREIVPYNLTDWRRLSVGTSDVLWASIQVKKIYTEYECFKVAQFS